ncbi:hypothetical protein Mapa_000092 [Marchantia paleacea]|nr:hypothetical protein Mapa_000092 [Marchantia paleacea]
MVTPAVCAAEELELWNMTSSSSTVPCPPSYTCDVFFTPHGYGDINITITWDGMDAIEHKVDVTSRGAPTIITALMEDTAGSILVTFDGVSDSGLRSLRGMRDGPERCEMLLDNTTYLKLGSNPSCGFKDAQTMYIQLGYNATIMPAGSPSPDYITLSREGVFAEHETSLPAAGSVLLRPPNKHPPLVAILSGPTVVGACDDFKLDASSSYGDGGRPMSFSYHAKGTGDLYKLSVLGAILETLPNDTMVVNIPPGSLEANYIYTFVVVVVNHLGKRATASVTITVSPTPVPILHIPGSAEVQTFSRGQIVTLEADVSIPGTQLYDLESGTCYDTSTKVNTTATQMIFIWTQVAGPFVNLFHLGNTGQRLNIAGNQLLVGQVYEFLVTVSMVGYPSQFSTAQAALQVRSSPIMVFIKGGDRAINASQDLILEAVAYDPDNLVDEFGNSYQYNYVWSCDTPITTPESLLYVYTDQNFGSMIKIPAYTLLNGTVYNYTVLVSKEGAAEPATAMASITPIDDTVTMTCDIANSADLHLGVYASSQVTIACTPGFESYNWSMTSMGDQRLLWELDPVVVIEGTIKIPPYQLLDARTYKITCRGRNGMGKVGIASVTFTTMMVPSGGTATLTTNSKKNAAGKTVYSVVAHGWMAGVGGGLLQYEFRYTYVKSKKLKEFIIQPLSTSNAVKDFVLLGGRVTLHVYVCDAGVPRIHSSDAPPGARFSLPTFKVSGKGRRSLLSQSFSDSYWLIANEGKYFNALTAMELLGTQSMNSQSSTCMGSNRNLVTKMLSTVVQNGPQVPPATSTGGQSEGMGASFALKQACVFSKLLGRAGNGNNMTMVKSLLELFLRDLRLIAEYGLNVGMQNGRPYDPCFIDAGNAFVQVVNQRCYKEVKYSFHQIELQVMAATIPNLIARLMVSESGFVGPRVIKRKFFKAAAIKFAMSADVYDGPNNASGTLLDLKFDITSVKPGGIPIGVAMSCFAKSPLMPAFLDDVKKTFAFKSLVSVCDVSFTGHTDGDWGVTTITGTWQKLSKVGKKDSYMPLMVPPDVNYTGGLKNVLALPDMAQFDFVRAQSRIILIKVKGNNLTATPPPPPPPPAPPGPPQTPSEPPPDSINFTTMTGAVGFRFSPPIKMTRMPRAGFKKTHSSSSRRWRYDDVRPQSMRRSGKRQHWMRIGPQSLNRSFAARFWYSLVGRS